MSRLRSRSTDADVVEEAPKTRSRKKSDSPESVKGRKDSEDDSAQMAQSSRVVNQTRAASKMR